MTEFDLSSLVHRLHHETDLTDHRQIAKEVRALIPDEHLEEALLEALTEYVRSKFVSMRGSITRSLLQGRPDSATTSGPQGDAATKSWKREGIRRFWWERQLKQRYGTPEGQKLLENFTRDDCLFQSSTDRDKAARLMSKAEEWETLAGLLKLHRVRTVGELAAKVGAPR